MEQATHFLARELVVAHRHLLAVVCCLTYYMRGSDNGAGQSTERPADDAHEPMFEQERAVHQMNDVNLTESKSYGPRPWHYQVWVDGKIYNTFDSSSRLTWSEGTDVVILYREAMASIAEAEQRLSTHHRWGLGREAPG